MYYGENEKAFNNPICVSRDKYLLKNLINASGLCLKNFLNWLISFKRQFRPSQTDIFLYKNFRRTNMVQRLGGQLRKCRSKLTKKTKNKGKISLTRYFAVFKQGDKVCLSVEPAVQTGRYHMRYHGKIGRIRNKQGKCYEVAVKDCSKEKIFIVHPIHLKRLQ